MKAVHCFSVFQYFRVLASGGLLLGAIASCSDRSSPATAQQALEEGLHQVSSLRFDTGYVAFDEAVRKGKPGTDLYVKALFGKATCAHHRMPPSSSTIQEAAQLYQQVERQEPGSLLAAKSLLSLGRIAEMRDYFGDEINMPLARQYYKQVAEKWDGQPIAGEATLRLAESYMQTYTEDDAITGVAFLEKYLDRHPDDPLKSAMWQYLGDSYFSPLSQVTENDAQRLVYYRKSVTAYQQAAKIGWMQKGRQGAIYWCVAKMADRYLNDAPLAAEYYAKIIIETPNSGKAYEAQLAIQRLNREHPELKAPVPPIKLFRTESESNAGKTEVNNHG